MEAINRKQEKDIKSNESRNSSRKQKQEEDGSMSLLLVEVLDLLHGEVEEGEVVPDRDD